MASTKQQRVLYSEKSLMYKQAQITDCSNLITTAILLPK